MNALQSIRAKSFCADIDRANADVRKGTRFIRPVPREWYERHVLNADQTHRALRDTEHGSYYVLAVRERTEVTTTWLPAFGRKRGFKRTIVSSHSEALVIERHLAHKLQLWIPDYRSYLTPYVATWQQHEIQGFAPVNGH